MDSQTALPPTDVVEADGNDLAGAQSVGSDQQKHRVVTQPHGRRRVDGSQKCTNCLPREGTWQLLEPVKPRGVDLAIQPGGSPTVCCRESEGIHAGRRCRVVDWPGSGVCRLWLT